MGAQAWVRVNGQWQRPATESGSSTNPPVDPPEGRRPVAIIGDSHIYQGGLGVDRFTTGLMNAGWNENEIFINGVSGRQIQWTDSTGSTSMAQIAAAKQALPQEPVWVFSLGSNGSSEADSVTDGQIDTVLAACGAGARVLWINTVQRDWPEPNRVRRNARIAAAVDRHPEVDMAVLDWASYCQTLPTDNLWNSDGLHHTGYGYELKNAWIIGKIVELGDSGGSNPDGYLAGWGNPVFEDTFDGSSIDTDKWNVWDNTYLDYDWGNITAAQSTVSGGVLRQRVSRRSTPIQRGGRNRHWDTAYMVSKFKQSYGRWEMRAKIPTHTNSSQGVWPAFWLRNQPATGEIDIMESWGGPTRNRTRGTNLESTSAFAIHQNTSGSADTYNHPIEWRTNPGQASYNTADDYHVWACEYTPDYLRIYFDGALAADIRPGGDNHPLASGAHSTKDLSWVWGPTFVDQPWEIRLNVQMGDNYWSSDDGEGSLTGAMPADYLIDYIRAWEYTP